MIRAGILPGQIKLAVQRLILIAFGRLLIDRRQTRPHNRIERFRDHLMLGQESLQRNHLLGGNVDQKIVRTFRRHLLLPAVEQIAAQHQ